MNRRIWLSFVVPVALALLTSFAVYRILLVNTRSLQQVSDTRLIESNLNALIKIVVDAETGERGFIITGNESFLTPYTTSTRDFGTVLTQLRRQLPEAEQAAALNEIDALFESWRREVAEVAIRARRRAPVGLAGSLDTASDAFSAARAVELRARLEDDQTLLTRLTSFLDEAQRSVERARELDQTGLRDADLQRAQAGLERYRGQLGADLSENVAARDETAPPLRDTLLALAREAEATEAQITLTIQSGAGKERIDRIRLLVDRTLVSAERRLERELLLSDLSSRRAQTLAFLGPLFAALISLYATVRGQRRLKDSVYQLAAVAKEVADGQLSKRLTLGPRDELADLAGDFNRMAESLTERERQTALLGELSSTLQTCLTQEEAYRATERYAEKLFSGLSGTLYIVSASRNLMERVAGWGEGATETNTAANVVYTPEDCWAFRRGRAQHVGGDRAGLLCAHTPTPTPLEGLCLPLMSQNETLGVLYLYSAPSGAAFQTPLEERLGSRTVQRFAGTVAEQLALALSNLKLRERLRQQSVRDPLTGLFNRRHLEETLVLELHRAERRREPLSVVMFDVDHFKSFNDTYGHDAGDSVLRSVSALVTRHIRAGDLPCRFGGEEFLLVQPGLAAEHARSRAESLRTAVRALSLEHAGRALGRVSISVGVATYPDHAGSAEALLKAADEALYRAKRGGRDRTVLAPALTSVSVLTGMPASEPPHTPPLTALPHVRSQDTNLEPSSE